MSAYFTLFFLSLSAATLLPIGSEALLLYDLSQNYTPWLLFIFATLGNTLGSIINYFIGLKGISFLIEKGYLTSDRLVSSKKLFKKYGAFALLLSWAPVIGDPITFVAGVLKFDFKWFVLLVLISKAMRYGVVIAVYLGFF
jgi:membrane protein YqaA with SNARE-associated domain